MVVCSFTNSMTLQAVFMFQRTKGQISITIALSKNLKTVSEIMLCKISWLDTGWVIDNACMPNIASSLILTPETEM